MYRTPGGKNRIGGRMWHVPGIRRSAWLPHRQPGKSDIVGSLKGGWNQIAQSSRALGENVSLCTDGTGRPVRGFQTGEK